MKAIAPNTGQVPGLPANPRSWTKGDVERIAKSLKDTPELFEARPLLVYPYGGQYVILGGNLRHAGAQRNHEKDAPCIVFPEDTPTDKLKEIVIKDNGSFGSWDYDALANEWDELPLPEWGVSAWVEESEDKGDNEPAPATHTEIVVCVPWTMDDDVDEIRDALAVVTDQFPGTYIKD